MNVSVFGCGRWGSFITWYLSGNGCKVTEWGRKGSKSLAVLKENGGNEYVELRKGVTLTDDLGAAVKFADIAVVSIKSQALREFAKSAKIFGLDKIPVVLCMKGIEEDTGKRLTEVMIEEGYDKDRLAVWIGPGHIQEFTAGKPNCMVIDGYNKELVRSLADSFRSNLIRFYYGDDVIGSEVGAAAKNVMGIAAGILDGGGFKTLKGPLMARGAREVARLIKAMGGNELSAYGLCHLGDYETTLFSEFSNNRRYGEELYLGKKFTKLAEGVSTAKAMKLLGERYGVDLPITLAVYRIIYENAEPLGELLALFSRSAKTEFSE
ncbi:MAG TPA: glycerol-3-phosphate dehydrogenase [Clostridiales bacterium]|nr:glycerol-3-phosphate dehydrogenase [Clostridiales bacterium]